MASRKKVKSKTKNLSLRERLGGHWNNGKWEAFVALYLRDRAASEATIWAGRLTDALFNALTKVLFVDRAPEAALDLADLLLKEAESSGDREAAECAGLARYFTRRSSALPASLPKASGLPLPAPYGALLAAMAARANNPFGGPAAALLSKLADQLRSAPSAKTLAPATALLKTAEGLEKASGGHPAFKAIRHMAALLREVKRKGAKGEELRSLSSLIRHPDFMAIPQCAHPGAVSRLWQTLCRAGGEKFGKGWADALGLLAPLFGGDGEKRKLLEDILRDIEAPPGIYPLMIAKTWPGRSDQERYIQSCLCLKGLWEYRGEEADDRLINSFMGHLKTIYEIGGKWRGAGNEWPPEAYNCIEAFLAAGGTMFWNALMNMDPPPPLIRFTALSLILVLVRYPKMLEPVREAAAGRPPSAMEDEEALVGLGDILAKSPPSPAALGIMASLLDEKSRLLLMRFWLDTTIEASAIKVAGGTAKGLPWEDIKGELLEKILKILPAGHRLALFIRLCRDGTAPRRLCDDKTRQDEFVRLLYAESKKEGEEGKISSLSANLFIMLTAWEGAGLHLMEHLFSLGSGYMDIVGLWEKAAQAVDRIKDEKARREVARVAAKTFKAGPKKRLSPGEKDALAMFDALARGKKPPRPKFPGGMLHGFTGNKDFDLFEFFDMIGRKGRRKKADGQ